MENFNNPLSFKIMHFAMKIERMSKKIKKIKNTEEIEKLAELQAVINKDFDEIHQKFNQIEKSILSEKK